MKTNMNSFIIYALCLVFVPSGCQKGSENENNSSYSLSFEQVLEITKREGICGGSSVGFLSAISGFLYGGYYETNGSDFWHDRFQCQLNASNCEEYLRCKELDLERSCDAGIEPWSSVACVDDTTLERCYRVIGLGSFIQTVDCVPYYSDSDQMCVEDDASNIGCTSGECPTDDPYADWCEKDVLMNCFQGLLRKRDCKERGLKCREATDQNGFLYAFCGTGEECPNEAPFCQGNRLTNCDANTHTEVVSYIDCDKKISGFICSEMDSWGWCGMPEEVDECEPGLINCDGDVAEICYFGKLITVDCSTFEDATCYKTPDDYPNSDLIMCISK